MKKKINLSLVTWLVLLITALIALAFETEILTPGVLAGEQQLNYIFNMLVVVNTLISLYLGLKMHDRPVLRLVLFSSVIVSAVIVYYLFYENTTLACAAMGLVCLLLMWPGSKSAPKI